MAEKDFVVKNGLVVNTAFSVNSTAIYYNDDPIANSSFFFKEANTANVANLAVYIVPNTGIVSNSSGVFVNSQYINTISSNLAYYVVANNGIVSNSSGVFVKSSNSVVVNSAGVFVNAKDGLVTNSSGLFVKSSNSIVTNSSGTFVNANNGLVSNSLGLFVRANTGIISNSSGVFLHSNNGIVSNSSGVFVNSSNSVVVNSSGVFVNSNNGLLSNSSGVFVLANSGIVSNTTGVYVNTTYISTLTANNTTYLNGQLASYYTNATNISTGTLASARLPQGTDLAIGGLKIVDSIANDSVDVAASAASVKTTYTAAIAANTRAASAQSSAIAAYTNATTFSSNATNITTGTLSSARLSGSYTGITNVGTQAQLTVSGNTNIDSGVFFVDTVNNLVGIGTTTPNTDLHVVGDGRVTNDFYVEGDLIISGNTVTSGETTYSGNLNPEISGTRLGNTTNRWYLSATYVDVSNTITIANTVSGVSVTINSTSFSGTSNNALYLAGTIASAYQLNSTLAANVQTLTANNSNNLGGELPSYYLDSTNLTGTIAYARLPVNVVNTTSDFTFTGRHTHNANVILGSSGLSSNGSFGTAGHVLHSNGTATYWAADYAGVTSLSAANGINGGTITSTGTLYVNAGDGIVVNTSGVHVDTTYIATLTSNNTVYLNGQLASYYTNATNISTGTLGSARISGAYTGISQVGTLSGLSVSGNSNFDSGVLFVDGTNNKVGVNTSSPSVSLTISANDAVQLPSGNTANRPTPQAGMLRYNNETGLFEGYSGGQWAQVTGTSYHKGNLGTIGFASNKGNLYKINSNTQTVDITIEAGENAMTAGPIIIDDGYNLTVETGGRVVIV
jgi:hypothetical protein